jgi:hypothetical protein
MGILVELEALLQFPPTWVKNKFSLIKKIYEIEKDNILNKYILKDLVINFFDMFYHFF